MAILHPEKIGIGAFEGGDPYDLPGGGTTYTPANDVILFNTLKNIGFRCYHTWHPPALTGDDNSVVRLPAWWGAGDLTTGALTSIQANGNLVVGSNEPWSGHFGSTVDECIAVWPSLMALGNRLAAPSISSWDPGSSDPWIDDFMTRIVTNGYRVDAQNVHFYTRTSDPTAATNEFLTYLNGIHTRYPMPIIITEWGLNDFGATGTSRSEYAAGVSQPHSMAQQIAFMQAAIPMLDSLSFVEKHFWYALTYDGSYDNYALMHGDGSLTPLGLAFYDMLHGVSSTPLIADFYKNGTLVGTTTQLPTSLLYPAVLLAHTGDAGTVNFGATAFSFLPSGAMGWDEGIPTTDLTAQAAQTLGVLGQSVAAAQGGVSTAWSSTDKGPDIIVSNGGLTATLSGTAAQSIRANNVGAPGDYFEVTFSNLVSTSGSPGVGVANASQTLTTGYPGTPNGVGYFSSGYAEWPGGTGNFGSYTVPEVIGVYWQDLFTFYFYRNGVFVGSTTAIPTGDLYPIILFTGNGNSVNTNFGATAFAYPPSGANPWGT